jgi:DNA-binding LytR/AlgR family response regulator
LSPSNNAIDQQTTYPEDAPIGLMTMKLQHATGTLHQLVNIEERRSALEHSTKIAHLLKSFEAMVKQSGLPSAKIAIKTKAGIVFVRPSDLMAAKAQGNYVLLQQMNSTHLLREQISVLAEQLEPYGFMRIHRSALINSAYVEAMVPQVSGEYSIRMKNGEKYNVARSYRNQVKELGVLWLGGGQGIAH